MGIFNWMQNKFNGKQEKKSPDFASTSKKKDASNEEIYVDELDRWPQTLLSIGTFGNKNGEEPRKSDESNSCSSQDPSDVTLDDFNKIQEFLKSLFTMKPKLGTTGTDKMEEERTNQQLSRILNCPLSFELVRSSFQKLYDEFEKNGGGNISPDMKIILSKAKDMLANKSKAIKQKSLRFLLKKTFLCRGGFAPGPDFVNSMPESRMEKVLRALLHKKIYPQYNTSISTKKYLDNKEAQTKHESEMEDKETDKCKWVKTDSEYIVLDLEI
ncbi:hypothetical protein LUZ61_006231 [Rhynchospora tenuis]|uniref:Uncharacterized protein n=1 Tax=Rhynchospora tenuis TaxID=198213 RepID=A0AAD5ZR60_9POAL|nr:hypothetical protein LUZ61_006231 [Rhynchospora tenuis]